MVLVANRVFAYMPFKSKDREFFFFEIYHLANANKIYVIQFQEKYRKTIIQNGSNRTFHIYILDFT